MNLSNSYSISSTIGLVMAIAATILLALVAGFAILACRSSEYLAAGELA